MKMIKKFSETGMKDISAVGGKNASLGEMYTHLTSKGISIPDGFAVTTDAYRSFIADNKLSLKLTRLLEKLDRNQFINLAEIGAQARSLILGGQIMTDLGLAIQEAYGQLCGAKELAVAVRSSATAEDLPDASFAGLHNSFLNVKGQLPLFNAVKQCFSSLYTDRAIKYRADKGFDHAKVFLSVGIQLMVRADLGCSGVGFTLEPESGFRNVIHLAGVWGLGENIVQGTVTPDEFLLFKPALMHHKKALIQKNLGSKSKTMVYTHDAKQSSGTVNIETPWQQRGKYVLNEEEITMLGNWALLIEEHYQHPMDFEWAKDGLSHQLYIIQARPETVHSLQKSTAFVTYQLQQKGEILTFGAAIGKRITCGYARILNSAKDAGKLMPGDILVTDTISPDWDPIIKKVAGIITNKGGRTSHAAIIARELGALAIVGTENATRKIKDGEMITISCAEGKTGYIYRDKISWKEKTTNLDAGKLPESPKAQFVMSDPGQAFYLSFYPNHGVGLLRLEFIISNLVQVHPMALVEFDKVRDETERMKIENLTCQYAQKEDYFIEQLAQGVATIAAAFYPKEVIVRMSDFKTNEYAGLLGGVYFEPEEENPMLGFRGASRYTHELYQEGFRLECAAMKMVKDEMGFTNVKLMIPFCRTVGEGEKVIKAMETYGLKHAENDLQIYVMAELPANVLLAEKFAALFDGFSIGSNDLTQLTLGVDRDSALVASLFDEQNEASLQLIKMMIKKAKELNRKVGICGQAPSDSAAFTELLVEWGIDSISFNPDALLVGIENIGKSSAVICAD